MNDSSLSAMPKSVIAKVVTALIIGGIAGMFAGQSFEISGGKALKGQLVPTLFGLVRTPANAPASPTVDLRSPRELDLPQTPEAPAFSFPDIPGFSGASGCPEPPPPPACSDDGDDGDDDDDDDDDDSDDDDDGEVCNPAICDNDEYTCRDGMPAHLVTSCREPDGCVTINYALNTVEYAYLCDGIDSSEDDDDDGDDGSDDDDDDGIESSEDDDDGDDDSDDDGRDCNSENCPLNPTDCVCDVGVGNFCWADVCEDNICKSRQWTNTGDCP